MTVATDIAGAQSYHATFEEHTTGAALPSIYMQSMQADLDRLKHDLPNHLQQNGQWLANYRMMRHSVG
jgi:hypothetical protein